VALLTVPASSSAVRGSSTYSDLNWAWTGLLLAPGSGTLNHLPLILVALLSPNGSLFVLLTPSGSLYLLELVCGGLSTYSD
jgi:hypothetical protein